MNKKYLLLMFSFILIILSINVYSAENLTYNTHGITLSNSGTATSSNFVGMGIRMKTNATGVIFNLTSGTTCYNFRITTADKTNIIASLNNSNTLTPRINVTLVNGTEYFFGMNHNTTGTCTFKYGTSTYPKVSESLDWIVGHDTTAPPGGNSTTQFNTMDSVWIIKQVADTIQTNISFLSQSPATITSTTLFSQNVNIAYNVTNLTSVNNTILQYKINHNNNCYGYLNGTCTFLNNTFYNQTSTTNTTQIYNFSLGENSIYHSVNYLNYNLFNQTHNTVTLNTVNDLYKSKIINFSQEDTLNYYEAMIKSTGTTTLYYCNNSYNTGNPGTSTFCAQIFSGIINFNHTHNAFSNHSLFIFSQNTTGYIGNVKSTSEGYFIFKGSVGNIVTLYTIPNSTNTSNYFSTSINNGVTYTDNSATQTLDSHIHQFSISDTFIYKGCLNKSGVFECTTETSTVLYNTLFPPVGVQILSPNASTYQQYVNISYIISQHPNAPTVNNSYINISLYNASGFIKHLKANALNTSYYWDSYKDNLTANTQYYLKINLTDTNGLKTEVQSEQFNFSANTWLNITAKDINNNTITTFNINATNQALGISTYYNTTNGTLYAQVIKDNIYNITIDATGYALYNNQQDILTTAYGNLTFILEKENGIRINIFSEVNGSSLNGTLFTIYTYLNNSTLVFTNTTNTSTISYYNLTAGNYTFRFENTLYAIKEYYVNIGNRSFQTLNAYMLQTSSNTIFTLLDESNGNIIQDVNFIIKKYINGSLVVVSSLTSDISGRVQLNYQANTPYYFTLTALNYNDKSFTLNPILFSSYNVKLTKSITQTYEADYSGVTITYTPKSLNNNAVQPISFTFGSPAGVFTNYGFNITFKGVTTNASGNNAYGSVLTANANISGATVGQTANVHYYYETSDGAINRYSFNIEIIGAQASNYTILSNKGKTYGLGDFERILIITIVLIIIAGAGVLYGGVYIGAFLAMFILGFFGYMGFINPWVAYPSIVFMFMYLIWGSSK